MNKLKCIAFSLTAGFAVAVNAKTVYIDCNMSDYTGHDGSTPELALQSLGAAVYYGGAGADGDTIVVAEGVYNDTTYNPTGWWGPTRLHLDGKKFYFKASGRVEKTIIEGALAEGSEFGYGEGAVRCVTAQGTRAAESVFEGFTFRNGSTAAEGNAITMGGGAVCSSDGGNDYLAGPYLVGCVIENCRAPRGIGFGGTFVRCTIRNTRFEHGKYFSDQSRFVNSLVTGNWVTTGDADYGNVMPNLCTFVNCTIAGNNCTLYMTEPSYAYNNLVSLSDFPLGGATKAGEFVDTVSTRVLMGPAFGDGRLRSGCVDAVRTGDAQYLAALGIPEEVDAFVDFYGNAIPKSGVICAGCSQGGEKGGLATPVCGPIVLSSPKMAFDGTRAGMENSYVYPTAYPTNIRVRTYNLAAGTRVFSYMYSALDNAHTYPVWGENDPTDVIPRASVDEVMTVGVRTTANVFWTDPSLDDYAAADGSFEHPYKRIQEAMDAGENTHAMFIVCAKAGTYGDEQDFETHEDWGTVGKFRFVMPVNLPIRLVAVDGPERTFLVGKRDPATDTGCGANAISGFAVKGMGEIQGFTIRECYASTDGDDGFNTTGRCATHYSYAADCNFDDCVITANVGSYAATGCGVFNRCRIVGNRAAVRTFGEYGALYSCVVSGNVIGDWNYQIHTSGSRIFNCSLVGDAGTIMFSGDSGSLRVNCAVDDGGRELTAYGGNWGCVYWGFAQYAGENYLRANPMFADKATGELRMAKVSEGVSRGVRPDDANANNWWLYAMTDVNRNPVTFDAAGRPNPGAYADAADGVYVDIPNGGAQVVSGGKIGFNVLNPGDELRIAVSSGNRPCAGVLVNGVTNDFESADGHVVAIDGSVGNALITAFYTSDWYVAPNGTAGATGFYPSDAKTLKSGLEAAQAGDTVWAKEGTYDQDTMMQDGGVYVRSRAVVPADVTLASLSGRDATVIRGAKATSEDVLPEGEEETGKGLGADAIRCVTLNAGSRVKGFTLKDGHTRAIVGESGTDRHSGCETCGGGVGAYGANRRQAWVEDCIIEDCAAYRGAGNMAVKSKNCVYRNNYAVYIGGASSDTVCYGDLTYGNTVHWGGNDNRGPACVLALESCTVMDGASCDNANTTLKNSLINGNINVGSLLSEGVVNCVFNNGNLSGASDEWRQAAQANKCVFADAGQLVFDDDMRPVVGSNCAVDRGDPGLNEETYATDALGGQRVYNGTVDVGAVEADWRPRYAKDIRKSKLAVIEASPMVKENDSGVVTLNGQSTLAAVWTDSRNANVDKEVSVRVTGNGVLYLKLNGEPVKEFTASTADPTYVFSNGLVSNNLAFEYVPGENDEGWAEVLNARTHIGSVVIIR